MVSYAVTLNCCLMVLMNQVKYVNICNSGHLNIAKFDSIVHNMYTRFTGILCSGCMKHLAASWAAVVMDSFIGKRKVQNYLDLIIVVMELQ